MKTFLAVAAVTLLAGCAAISRPTVPTTGEAPAAPPYEAWARVLERFVDDHGRIDFAALARDRSDLDRFVAYVHEWGPNNAPHWFPTRNHALAFHLNAYNALAMHKVIETGTPATLAGWRKVGFFLLGKVRVGGEAISLYDYENRVIRGFGDARVHMALNCMSVGCPRLPRGPFRAEALDSQLDREARYFFNEPRNVAVDEARKVLRLSEILEFWTADFLAAAPTLAAFVNRYRDRPVPESYAVEFSDYDWTINRKP